LQLSRIGKHKKAQQLSTGTGLQHNEVIMDIKNNSVKSTFKRIVIDTLGFMACFTVLMLVCVGMLHSCAVEQANQEIQADAWQKQLEKGEVVEMKARVGGAQ
jgi:hypothetical protein